MSGAIATAAIIGGIGAAGSIGGAAIASSGSKKAAQTQANSADQAAQLQYQASQNALDFQKQQWATTQQNEQPWLQSGTGGLNKLNYLLGITPESPSQFGASGNAALGIPGGYGASGFQQSPVGTSPLGTPTTPTFGSPVRPTGLQSNAALGIGGANNPNAGGFSTSLSTPGASPTGIAQPPSSGSLAQRTVPIGTPVASPALGGSSSASPLSPVTMGGGEGPGIGVPRATPAMPVNGGGGVASASAYSPTGAPAAASSAGGYGSLLSPYPGGSFQAPSGLTEQNDPGYQARLQLGLTALDKSAAARGGVLTGGVAQAENQAAQDYASNEYGNVYNRALTGYNTNYNVWNNDQTNEFNRLAAIAGVGQTAANSLSTAGQNAANNVTSNLLGTASNMGNAYMNAGAANASGIYNSSAAYGGALGGLGGNLSNLYYLSQLQGLNNGGAIMNYNSPSSYGNELSYGS